MAINFNLLSPQIVNQPGQQAQTNGFGQPTPQDQGAFSQSVGRVFPQQQSGGGGGGGEDSGGGIGELIGGLADFAGMGAGQAVDSPSGPTGGYVGNAIGMDRPTSLPTGDNSSSLGQLPNQGSNGGLSSGINSSIDSGLNSPGVFGTAQKLIGQSENNPTIRGYLQSANPGLDPAKTPWCAGFVGSVLGANGIKGTGSLAAKSYLGYGQPTDSPKQGDIVVFNDLSGKNDPAHGHVGFVNSIDTKSGMVSVLGGNQGNSVSIKQYPISAVAGYRVPPSATEVQGYAKQNNIQTPEHLANLTQEPQQQSISKVSPVSDQPTLQNTLSGSLRQAAPVQPSINANQNGFSNKPLDTSSPIGQAIQSSRNVYKDSPVMGDLAASQAILESRLNGKTSKLASDYNNYFGIKGKGTAGSAMMGTQEYVAGRMRSTKAGFAANQTKEDSFTQHQNLMNKDRYRSVREAKTVEEGAVALQRSGYATDPQYAKKVIEIYNKYVKPYRSMDNSTNVNRQTNLDEKYTESNKYIDPKKINIPSLPQEQYNDVVRQLDQGRDDYASNSTSKKINWKLLQNLNNKGV